MTKRVAIYTRVSKDKFGDGRSPTRQEADGRAFAAIREWEVVASYRDVDLSAYQPGVRRPAYEALLEAVASAFEVVEHLPQGHPQPLQPGMGLLDLAIRRMASSRAS